MPHAAARNDLSRSLTALAEDSTPIAAVEMSQASWLVGGIVPGGERHPAKKLEASEGLLLALLYRWREEAFAVSSRVCANRPSGWSSCIRPRECPAAQHASRTAPRVKPVG